MPGSCEGKGESDSRATCVRGNEGTVMTRETIHIGRYCIAGNVFGRKLSQIKIFHIEKFGKLLAGKDDTPPIFTEKTFANRYMYMYLTCTTSRNL